MPLKTPEEYLHSIQRDVNLYMFGEKIKNFWNHPIIKPSINTIKKTYELAQIEEYKDLMTAKSSLTGEIVNRFCHIHQSIEDLIKKVRMQRLVGQNTACCFQRCVGWDAANALYSVTFEIDKKYGRDYHQRFVDFWKTIQNQDLVVDGAMTDSKGDRGKRPIDQPDPDAFLHIVEEDDGGIVVRGAKIHQTGFLNSHKAIVMPTLSMRPGEEEYAISFAVDTNEKGITMIYGRQSCDTRKIEDSTLDIGNFKYGGQEIFVIFDNVYVPKENIFMKGEVEFSGELVNRFAGYHRQSYGGCKVGVGDALIGAAALIAKYNGVEKSSHIRDKLVEMVHLNETLFSCGISCSSLGFERDAGNYEMDMLLANVCKQNVTRFPYEIARLAEDLAGGIIATMPSEKDLNSQEIGSLLKKYLITCNDIECENRYKVLRFIEGLTMGVASVSYKTESMHGAGSPQAQRIMISRQANLEEKMKLVKKILDIEE
ncbi:MAG: 4-hydroxybutyryl-CoA dehydratase [Candidatus Lokiarchaeota archaeon]|nr:4-hydroxybutyryl-CoA dehydratase [Candidatus Lokiarchaeota archaeon]MBD3340808.1 4-hydroxybutyryl-CoA dehydratase [Candidatus Lokiarchaeota archaeon]